MQDNVTQCVLTIWKEYNYGASASYDACFPVSGMVKWDTPVKQLQKVTKLSLLIVNSWHGKKSRDCVWAVASGQEEVCESGQVQLQGLLWKVIFMKSWMFRLRVIWFPSFFNPLSVTGFKLSISVPSHLKFNFLMLFIMSIT